MFPKKHRMKCGTKPAGTFVLVDIREARHLDDFIDLADTKVIPVNKPITKTTTCLQCVFRRRFPGTECERQQGDRITLLGKYGLTHLELLDKRLELRGILCGILHDMSSSVDSDRMEPDSPSVRFCFSSSSRRRASLIAESTSASLLSDLSIL